ncbi:hypothetical protein PbJCM13498_02130 [Prolixibacter bellariivorans]|uniref:Uncharacterized protein n=2 Tax=Prolixibacter bellariivorans TaxID=314319 RepID=A0A5M4ATU1_9BACT|nr:hypothetical protein PbJCM13498_02130 [Prolixibacter bellariivorans]
MMSEALCCNEQEKLYVQVTCLTGCKVYGDTLNVLMILEEKCPSSEVDILRQQLENILRYEHLEIFANTNLFMEPWLE